MNAWADIIVTGKEVANVTVTQDSESSLDRQRLEFEIRKYEDERQFRLMERERVERKEREELERVEQREREERDIRKQEIEFKRQELRLRTEE